LNSILLPVLSLFSLLATAHEPVVVVRRTYEANVSHCLQELKGSNCYVHTSLAGGAQHYDYSTSAKIEVAPQRQLTVQADEYGYQVFWHGPAGMTPDEIRHDFFVGLTKHASEAPVFIQLYREATPAEAELPPGTALVEDVDYVETTLGRALGVKRNIAVRAEDCAKAFSHNSCEVTYLTEEDADHPGPPFASIQAELKYSFPDGSSFRATDSDSYHGFTLSYQPADPTENDAAKLEKIAVGLQALKGSEPDAYLSVYAFVPNDPALALQDAYASGAIVDVPVAPAVYATETTWTIDLAECRKTYDSKQQACWVDAAGQAVTEPAPLFDHALDFEKKRVSVASRGFVEVAPTGQGYRLSLITAEAVAQEDAWPLLEKAFESLETKTISTKRMKVFAPHD